MKRLAVVGAVAAAFVVGPAAAAQAHPLGNFTVNHYNGLTLYADRVAVMSIVDAAEIPTAQLRGRVDADNDGTLSSGERADYAVRSCAELRKRLTLSVATAALALRPDGASFVLQPGAAGLETSRLVCRSSAAVALSREASTVRFADSYLADRIGWHEVTARGVGVHLVRSPVPATSVSDELRNYPGDLLSSPLDVRAAVIDVQPGAGLSTVARGIDAVPGAGPVARLVERLNQTFSNLAGAEHLTLGVGLLAVLVSLLLGASHAALPGHGKTVMAAYLAGKRGTVRDAVVVGATVTATHTLGVLLLGLALTTSSSLAGDEIIGDLGVGSGVLVALIGIGLVASAVRRRRGAGSGLAHGQAHGHEHPHGHSHGHGHGHAHSHSHGPDRGRIGRPGLVGMGVAGGLVPSPSALVVLLGAVALGRTMFGVLLVLTYGLGMAGTLTAAGLVAVRLSERWRDRIGAMRLARRLGEATPIVTGGLVVVVGMGLAARSLAVL
jgi:ABC-type nickel/cobalt efflux system permease component RcnA